MEHDYEAEVSSLLKCYENKAIQLLEDSGDFDFNEKDIRLTQRDLLIQAISCRSEGQDCDKEALKDVNLSLASSLLKVNFHHVSVN